MQSLYVYIEKAKNQRLNTRILKFFLQKNYKNNIFITYAYLEYIIVHILYKFIYFLEQYFGILHKWYKL